MTKEFHDIFKSDADLLAYGPGRLEILGNHTDYNEGFVLSTAVDKKTTISFKKRSDKIAKVYSPFFAEQGIREIDLNDIDTPLAGKDWLNYVRGVLNEFKKRGLTLGGFEAYIGSDVPLSAGMSSSASLEIALIEGLCALFNNELDNQQKAVIGQACENKYIGANTGLMDQLTSLSGKANQLVQSEYRYLTVAHLAFPQNLSWIVVNSGVKHDLSEEYNERRESCENAAAKIKQKLTKIKTLRDLSPEVLETNKDLLSEIELMRARHVCAENARVLEAQKLLAQGSFVEFGQLLFDSHASSIKNFENSCSELDVLVDFAKQSPLCLGARLSGGGFGGISIHLVENKNREEYKNEVTKFMGLTEDDEPMIWDCIVADGSKVEWNK